ncbi:MAG: Asp-tRNA(Asn)/Glu-tRNA(Gln) amidotransferase subunit GatA [Dehalococcoidia bacterium]|nr:Asp-tRNA(Asn)/Glu-tRNA(Gln) amidotransferase subunit GatA [Dehalococcoidia bacterium]
MPDKFGLWQLTVHEAQSRLAKRDISSVELTESVLQRVQDVEDRVKSYVTVTADLALAQAREADRRLARGEASPLTGVPVAIKDVLSTKGVRTTCSSKMLENFVPIYDATVIEKLKRQGMVMVGKTNMDEFAMGSSTENSAFFTTHNPWDLERVPGGSSGGSAAAVAAGEALFSLGSDTGGSIRQPASLCGVVGVKPTYGRVSRYGLVAFASSLDQVGPFTTNVRDCATVLNAICGHDPLDSTSSPKQVPDFSRALSPDLRGLKVGVPKEYFVDGIQPEVADLVRSAVRELEKLGAEVDWDVSLPHTQYGLAAYYIIATSEASANLARYDGVKYGFSVREASDVWDAMMKTRQYGFGEEVKRRIMLGTYALSAGYYDAYYLKAQKVRTLIKQDFDAAFEKYHVLVAPTSPSVAFKIGEKVANPLHMYLSDVCTIPVNIAGLPAISIPAGLAAGLPVGLQIIGRPFDEETILKVAYAYEQATKWHKTRPVLPAKDRSRR